MHNREKYPDIWPIFEKAKKELDTLKAKRAKHLDVINATQVEIDALLARKAKANELAMEDHDRIAELTNKVKALAQAMGGKTVSNT